MANVITNHDVTMLQSLQDSCARVRKIKFIVSFVLESGVRLLLPGLRGALAQGAEVQILTSRYLDITEPSALYFLGDLFSPPIGLEKILSSASP